MSTHEHSHDGQPPQGPFLASRAGLVLLGFLAIGGFLLFTEHRAHVLGALFYLLPLGCVFMHFFMHGGHGHGGHGGHRNRSDERNPS
ncbi:MULTISPECIES: DUF2933 domain-containing protein [unclassified Mesorhizobium]|uniref:DUF2933 domain-containing protein n=1 Tax=unclassified Mesorhizobium TaxID=325217 RepID=UPI000FCC5DFD|nr:MULTISPECIES: DUF2933 domain-containing protein [unclassified Mesorhizobium]RUW38048.1 DUF2933 domain-containing protein [Mesorhizobium sp. M1E.F.Ca.ET.041.01.1.1]RWD89015.1 MAG: DUF2933 domain-containing protein [Mesorhizobium sp.]RWD93723.1 MAG: DUF2933 domain-containing protein [Mesorhizobium sp.]TIV53754.1 MAG: DUF2933 domain-containing protein [Mesorhizobium sp.]